MEILITLKLDDNPPFGKHKNKSFRELITDKEWGYILWLNKILQKNYQKDKTLAKIEIDKSIIEECSSSFRSLKGYYWKFKSTTSKFITEGDLAMQDMDSEIYLSTN